MTQRTHRKKLSDEVSDHILAMIDNDEISLGGQLPTEGELVEMLNVSRTSVREGVKSLAALGVLKIHQGMGTFVVGARPGLLRSLPGQSGPLNKSDLLELLELRYILEPEAAALAASRATPEDIKEMHRCVEELESGVAEGIRPPEDLGFHMALARATKNSAVVDVSNLTIRFYEQDMHMPDDLDVEGHREIYEAIKNGNPDAARKAMGTHLEEIKRRCHERYPEDKATSVT